MVLRASLALSVLFAAAFVQVEPTNDAPNPFTATEKWGTLPEGRQWGSTSAVDIARDGRSIWVAERCGQNASTGRATNRCLDRASGEWSPHDPVMLFDQSGKLVRSFGAKMIRIEGWEHAERVRTSANGVIFLSCHIGNWEWAGVMFAQHGFRLKAVALDHGVGRVTRFFSERRRAKGIEPLPLSGSTFAMIEWLRAGGAVGVIADRDYAHQGVLVHFFGAPAVMPRAHAILASKTGAPIVPCFLLREAEDHFRLIIEPPVWAAEFEHLETDHWVRALVERCLHTFEGVIRRYPDQWFVFAPLWEEGGTG